MTAKEAYNKLVAVAQEISDGDPDEFAMVVAAKFGGGKVGDPNTILSAYGRNGDLVEVMSQYAAQYPAIFNVAVLSLIVRAIDNWELNMVKPINEKPV